MPVIGLQWKVRSEHETTERMKEGFVGAFCFLPVMLVKIETSTRDHLSVQLFSCSCSSSIFERQILRNFGGKHDTKLELIEVATYVSSTDATKLMLDKLSEIITKLHGLAQRSDLKVRPLAFNELNSQRDLRENESLVSWRFTCPTNTNYPNSFGSGKLIENVSSTHHSMNTIENTTRRRLNSARSFLQG